MTKIKKSDVVIVMKGKDKGKKGKVLKVYPKNNRILVQGVNLAKRHMKQRSQDVPAGIIEIEATLHISNVMLLCSKCGKSSRAGYKILEDGTKMRICRRCGETI